MRTDGSETKPMDRQESAEGRPMLSDLRRQAVCLAGLMARGEEFARQFHELGPKGTGRIYAFGCGDGWFAARAVADYARGSLGLPFSAFSALEMLAYAVPALGPDDLVIAISMSGSADRTNEAAEAARAQGATVLALTNGSGGALAAIAHAKLSLDVSDLAPFLTGTTKYTATVLGLLLFLSGGVTADLTALVASLPNLVPRAEDFARAAIAALGDRPVTGVRILSAGANMATADYGTAKFIKLVTLPIWSDDIEEFAHRQFWSCPASDLVIYIAANPAVARCAAGSAAALGSMGMRTIAIDTQDAPVPTAMTRLTLPALGEALSPLAAAIPVQCLAYFLARALGGTPDESQDESDPARFYASQLLARRGELAGTAT